MNSLEFWSGVIVVVIVQLAGIYNNYRNHKAQEPLVEAQADAAQSEGWVKLAGEYARQIESLKKLEVENSELRPLVLKLALQEKDIEQKEKDKADWKKYSETLVKQIEEMGQIPLPFRRLPSNGDTGKHTVVTQSKIKAVKTEEAK